MDIQTDPVAVIGTACRLPGSVHTLAQLWSLLYEPISTSTPPPISRGFEVVSKSGVIRAGWLPPSSLEAYDSEFFRITPGEADDLRPNIRLALELTYEAFQNAGIDPSSLKGKNVSVNIAMGAEDGWEIKRFAEDGPDAFDNNWAQNSDPSAVPGRIAHFFDFQGPISSVSGACAGGSNALDSGIRSLYSQDSVIAVVGATTTHLMPAAFQWASSVNVASKNGRCSAFSADADGYVPSEGAVFMILQRASCAIPAGRKIDGFIRGLALRHSGYTRTLSTPNPIAQKALIEGVLKESRIDKNDVVLLEAHGTGTRLGDMIEMEAIKGVFGGMKDPPDHPLILSSVKTVLGHTQAAAALAGILKVLLCFKHHEIPPHGVRPTNDLLSGSIMIPTVPTSISNNRPFVALVSSFGFTGGISSIVLQDYESTIAALNIPLPSALKEPKQPNRTNDRYYVLPFSAKTKEALVDLIKNTRAWMLPPLSQKDTENDGAVDLSAVTLEPGAGAEATIEHLAYLLAVTREHFPVRKAFVAKTIQEFLQLSTDGSELDGIDRTVERSLVDAARTSLEASESQEFDGSNRRVADALALAYTEGNVNASFAGVYCNAGTMVPSSLLRSFPLYPFQRKHHWRVPVIHGEQLRGLSPETAFENTFAEPSLHAVSSLIKETLRLPKDLSLTPETNILDLGMNSLNSIELASSLTKKFGGRVDANRLYQLTLLKDIMVLLEEEYNKYERTDDTLQAELDTLVQKFSQEPLEVCDPSQSASDVEPEDTGPMVLLTGATGFLGARTLDHLLRFLPSSTRIACLVRGDAAPRLISSFDKHAIPTASLLEAIASGRVLPFGVSDLSELYLGASEPAYQTLLSSVRIIIHLAWSVDFNKPALSFQSDMRGARSLAQLAAKSKHRVALYFATSFSTTFGYKGADFVPEKPLELDATYALDQGYAISKMATEHMLYHLAAQEGVKFEVHIVRIGQISGDSSTGEWTIDEMIPMIMASLPVLGAVPKELPNVSWIPVDTCAQVICDLIKPNLTIEGFTDPKNTFVYNVSNPRSFGWKATADLFAYAANLPLPRLVSLGDYVSLIQKAREKYGSQTTDYVPVIRLLPSFLGGLEGRGWLEHYALLDVSLTKNISPSLAACFPIDEKMAILLMRKIMEKMYAKAHSLAHLPQRAPPINAEGPKNYVFLFGPWSDLSEKSITSDVMGIWKRLQKTAVSVVNDVFKKHPWLNTRNKDILHKGHSFGRMLLTLALQLHNCDQLIRRGIQPRALIGYCFGEYAASVIGGYMTEHEAVDVLTRRSLALSEGVRLTENATSKSGAMLNVFANSDVVRRHIFLLPEPVAEVAIHAGPSHTVLSGNIQVITRAQEHFNASGIRTITVSTDIPFHSREMNAAVDVLTMLTHDYSSFTRIKNTIQCVSGVTGRNFPSSGITVRYWERHMRERVKFLECMETIRAQFADSDLKLDEVAFLDIGPSGTLKKMVSRYKWDGLVCEQSDVYLEGNTYDLKLRLPQFGVPLPNTSITSMKTASDALKQFQTPIISPPLEIIHSSSDSESLPTPLESVSWSSSPHEASHMHSSMSFEATSTIATSAKNTAGKICLELLSRLFGYSQDNADLLQETFTTLGLGSLDFVQFRSEFETAMGASFPPSSYGSDEPISRILQNLE